MSTLTSDEKQLFTYFRVSALDVTYTLAHPKTQTKYVYIENEKQERIVLTTNEFFCILDKIFKYKQNPQENSYD